MTALFFGLMCMFLAVGFLARVPVDLGATTSLEQHTRASYIADAAIVDTMAYLSFELANGREPCSGPSYTNTGVLGEWTWQCVVVPDANTPPNGVSNVRLYNLTATAFLDGEERYRIVADVQGGQSFARFSMFIDDHGEPTYDFIIYSATRMSGPVHKNRPIRFLVRNDGGYGVGDPPVNSKISTTEDQNQWSIEYSPFHPTLTEDGYELIFENGEADLEYNALPRPLPTDSLILAQAAWGGSVSGPPLGVTVNQMGGVYINGDVTRMTLDVNGSGHFVLRVEQGSDITEIVEDTGLSARVVTRPDGSVATTSGLGTGVIYCDGDILALSGRNKGAHTIVTKFEDGKNIEIAGPLLRSDTVAGQEPTGSDDRLGIVANTVTVAEHSVLPRNVNLPLYLYATFLTTNTFHVKGWYPSIDGFGHGDPPGAMAIYGGVTCGETWKVCETSGMLVTHGYGGLSGYGTPDIHYDKLLANEPPPEYPTTEATELRIRSWKEQRL